MSLIRTGLFLAAVVMLLPAEEKKQAELTTTATRSAEQAASFCERNPSTCANGRDAWALFLRKAEYGMELGARMLRQQLLGVVSPEPGLQNGVQTGMQPAVVPVVAPARIPAQQVPSQPARTETPPARRSAYQMDNPSRWR